MHLLKPLPGACSLDLFRFRVYNFRLEVAGAHAFHDYACKVL